ncbi:MAG: cupin domain-containing protein [Candidatus Binatia bacterium]
MSLDQFNEELKKKNLLGYWMIPDRSDGFREPDVPYGPFLWKWAELEGALQRASQYIRPEEAYRRFVGYQHPQLKMGTSHTLLMGGQMVRPGEFAPAHRHMMEAIRFVVKGRGAYTVVEGEQFPMEEGDFITTPNWTWHNHVNAGDTPIIWLDGANGLMIRYFHVVFAEPHHQSQQVVTHPAGWSQRQYGTVRPQGSVPSDPTYRPPYRYPWSETEKALNALAASPSDPFDGVLFRYVDPISGGYTLPTMSCEIQMLRPGETCRSHRHTYTVIYHAFRGEGTTVVGGKRLDWKRGDSFVVPLWNWHSHENRSTEPAVLFSINDRPAIEALRFYCEESQGS